jgi:hypothetical protein
MLLDVSNMIRNIEKGGLALGVSKEILATGATEDDLFEHREVFDIVSGDES